jgi:hypothetical protein
MQPGNLVIIVAAGRRRLVVEVAGDYTWNLEPPPLVVGNYQHQRRVRLRRDLDPNRLWVQGGAGPVPGDNVRWALIRLAWQPNVIAV